MAVLPFFLFSGLDAFVSEVRTFVHDQQGAQVQEERWRAQFGRLMRQVIDKVEGVDTKVESVDAKVDTRITQLETKLDTKLDTKIGQLDTKIGQLDAKIDALMEQLMNRLPNTNTPPSSKRGAR